MNEVIKTGILAYGMSGKVFHAPFIENHPGFELTTVVERSKNDVLLDYPNAKQSRDIDGVINDPEIELIIVNTPNFTHFEYAKAALNAGKHVLIEKPISVLRNEAEELFTLAYRKNLNVFAFQNRRFDSDFLSVKKTVESGKLGKIVEAHFRFDRYRNEISHKFFKEQNIPGSGILYDLGAHVIDQAISLFGIPNDFNKTYSKNRKQSEVDDYASVHLKYNSGLNVYITVNMLVLDPPPAYTIFGSNGSFKKDRADIQEPQLLAGTNPLDPKYGEENPEQTGILNFYDDNNMLIKENVKAEKGNYMLLFNEIFDTIKNQKEYSIRPNEILSQLGILEK